jgi:hypothetical protein
VAGKTKTEQDREALREYCTGMAFELAALARAGGLPFMGFLFALAYYEGQEPSGIEDVPADEAAFVPKVTKRPARRTR